MVILIDIGNTNTHIGVSSGKGIFQRIEIPTGNLSENNLKKKFFSQRSIKSGLKKVDGAIIASVVPDATKKVKSFFIKNFSIEPFVLDHTNAPLPGFNYPKPQTLGADRIANAIAAVHLYGAPSIIADFGTAITIDVVNSNGFFEGGVILPGVSVMTDYLFEKTALLPAVDFRIFKKPFGKNTEEAILAGINTGFYGMISHIIQNIIKELKLSKPAIIATGGYGLLFSKQLSIFTHRNKNLTLMGLLITYNSLIKNRTRTDNEQD